MEQRMINSSQRRPRRLMAALLATTMLVGAGAAWTLHTPAQAQNHSALAAVTQAQPGFADLAAKVKPAVVNIAVTEKVASAKEGAGGMQQMPFPPGSPMAEMFKKFFEQQQGRMPDRQPRRGAGSGFIIDPTGYIVTNNHVVDGASKVTVTLDDGTIHTATVKGRDDKTDLALIKIETDKKLPYVEFGESEKTRVGDWVVAVGNPFGLGGTVTAGILSANGRNIGAGPYDDFLQFDAPINPGNSGGPLFDQSGKVIGVSSAIYSPSGGNVGIGFAVPSSLAKTVIADLREHGSVERGWLGVQMQPVTPQLAKAMGLSSTNGVVVNKVEPDSPAAKAKLQQGDVITAFNGQTIKTGRDLAMHVAGTRADTSAKLTVWRDGKEQTLDVTVAKLKTDKLASAGDVKTEETGPIGLSLAPLTPKMRERLELGDDAKGVVVAKVAPDSRAAEGGLKTGDVIVRVGNDAVTTPEEATAKIKAAEKAKKEAVPLLIAREGTTYYLALPLVKS
jgi:serine protease Do